MQQLGDTPGRVSEHWIGFAWLIDPGTTLIAVSTPSYSDGYRLGQEATNSQG
jgi:hypothetical protein